MTVSEAISTLQEILAVEGDIHFSMVVEIDDMFAIHTNPAIEVIMVPDDEGVEHRTAAMMSAELAEENESHLRLV